MVKKSEEEWQESLSKEQYYVARQGGTERPFTGVFNVHKETGVYHCVCCEAPLFDSTQKFDSGCGWPSFEAHIDNNNIKFLEDRSHGMTRTEVQCAQCEAHLGHIFDDGPTDTGKRYCINSASLGFVLRED